MAIHCMNTHAKPSKLCRIVKQALRSSGANVTEKHIVDISMCALFLMEAAKQTDKIFQVPPPTTKHTVRDSLSDIRKIQSYVMENKITHEDDERTGVAFLDPTDAGLNKLTSGNWLKTQLAKKVDTEDLYEDQSYEDLELDIDYELFQI